MSEDAERRIVVGVHGSAASLLALRWAARQAESLHARLHVVCAWEYEVASVAPYARHGGAPGREEVRRTVSMGLRQALQGVLGDSSPFPVTVEVAEGRAACVLPDRAEGAELLVLGVNARRGGECIGPVARVCLRRAPCPVVVVRTDVARALAVA